MHRTPSTPQIRTTAALATEPTPNAMTNRCIRTLTAQAYGALLSRFTVLIERRARALASGAWQAA